MIRSLRAIVVVVLVAIIGVWSASTHAASAAESGVGVPAYNYDSRPFGSASSRAHYERGPPATAADYCSHTVLTARPFGGLVMRTYTFDHPERHLYTDIATLSRRAPPATVGQLAWKGDFVSLDPSPVAAKAGGAYGTALSGGRHAGFLANYAGKPTAQIERGITSIEKQIAAHQAKIANPGRYIDQWASLDPRQQQALVNSKWPGDIARQQEQLDILRGILGSR